jgi:hypothetical protein
VTALVVIAVSDAMTPVWDRLAIIVCDAVWTWDRVTR